MAEVDTLKGFSYGLQLNMFTYSKWNSIGEETMSTWSGNERVGVLGYVLGNNRTENVFLFSNYNGFFFNYQSKSDFVYEISFSHSYEQIGGVKIVDTLTNGNVSIKRISNYIVNYFQIPIRFGYYIWDDANYKKKAIFFSVGINIDFAFFETSNYGNKNYYYSNGQPVPFTQEKLSGSDSFRFNKISPFIYVGREKFNKKGTFSFRYGSMVVFKSFYQKHNTGEYLKNYKISPLIIGFAYHF